MQCTVIDCRLNLPAPYTEKSPNLKLANVPNRSVLKLNSSLLRILTRTGNDDRISYRRSSFRCIPLKLSTLATNNYLGTINALIRDIWNFMWSGCFNISWICASWIISISFFCHNLVAEARDDTFSLLGYGCEDVQNYYAGLEHLSGEPLKEKLNSNISRHQFLSYKEVWDALMILDAADVDKPEASSGVVEIYSLRVVPKLLAGKPEGWNREHLWPRSYGLINTASLTDLHNIRPADMNVNSSRGNKYYGECHLSSTYCLKPAAKEAALDTETDKERWAPPLQVRGDIARALMYMAVCYGSHQSGGGLDLHLSDSPNIVNREMGLLSTLLKWNNIDPPSREEKIRNERICRLYQHNRNPFVDHPEYANLIWRQAVPNGQGSYTPYQKAWINEFHYNSKGRDQNEFVEIVVQQSINAAELELALYNGSNGKMYSFLPLVDKVFRVTGGGSGFLIYTASLSIQNGPADGIALLSIDSKSIEVIHFISYSGVVKAVDGPARGYESLDIGVKETEESFDDDSLGLTGVQVGEYNWKKIVNGASPGKPNIGQILLN